MKENLQQTGEKGIVRRTVDKGFNIAAKVSRFTLIPSAGIWATTEFAPSVIEAVGLDPESVSDVAAVATIADAATIFVDKARGGSQKNEAPSRAGGTIFLAPFRVAKDWAGTAFGQANPVQGSTKHAFGF